MNDSADAKLFFWIFSLLGAASMIIAIFGYWIVFEFNSNGISTEIEDARGLIFDRFRSPIRAEDEPGRFEETQDDDFIDSDSVHYILTETSNNGLLEENAFSPFSSDDVGGKRSYQFFRSNDDASQRSLSNYSRDR